MSGINGDKARFHRDRKEKIARRSRNRDLLKRAAAEPKQSGTSPVSKRKPVTA